MSIRSVELHIEELVLHGFETRHSDSIARAAERELARLLVEHGVPSSLAGGGQVARLVGVGFEVVRGAKPEVIGTQVARTIHRDSLR